MSDQKLVWHNKLVLSWLWYNGQKLFKPVKNPIYNKEIEYDIFNKSTSF